MEFWVNPDVWRTNPSLVEQRRKFSVFQSWIMALYSAFISMPITFPWIAFFLGLLATTWQVLDRLRSGNLKKHLPPLTVPIFALMAVYFVSGFVNGYYDHGLLKEGWKEANASVMVLRPFFVYFWAYYAFFYNPEAETKVVPCALLVGAAAGLTAMVQQLFDLHMGYKYLQGTGFINGPMAFSGVMQLLSLVSLGVWVTGAYKWCPGPFKEKWIFSTIAVANILGLIFAGERSGWLGFVVGAFVVTACVSRKLVARIALIGAVTAAIGWFAVPMVQARLLPLLDWKHEASSIQRMAIWNHAWKQYTHSVRREIIGVGPKKFDPIPVGDLPGKQELEHAHSNYLHSLTITGAIGFVVYLWLSFASIFLAWKNYDRARKEPSLSRIHLGISLGILGGLVSLMVAGFFEYNFGTGNVRMAQWFLVALLSTAQKFGDIPFLQFKSVNKSKSSPGSKGKLKYIQPDKKSAAKNKRDRQGKRRRKK